MALIKCEECGSNVSNKAKMCPNCGNPMESGEQAYDNIHEKKNFNIYSILALVCTIASMILSTSNSTVGGVLIILSFILSIIGVVKANKIKKIIGKRKGIVLSVTLLSLYILMFLVFFLDEDTNSNKTIENNSIRQDNNSNKNEAVVSTLDKQDNNSNRDEYDDYKEIFSQIKILKQSLNSPNSFQLNRVSLYTAEEGTYFCQYFNALVDYSGENVLGGTVRKYKVYKFTVNNENNSKNLEFVSSKGYDSDRYDLAEYDAKSSPQDIGMTNGITKDLNVNRVLEYINN